MRQYKMGEADQKYNMSKEGLEELQREMKERSDKKRPKLKGMIEEMRSRGDLSENDGYTLAIEDFESNERRIAELNDLIENAEIIKRHDGGHDKVQIGCKVVVEIGGKEIEYTLVGPSEANPLENKLSLNTPLGQAIVNRKQGDICEFDLPMGKQTLTIKGIN